MPSELDPASLDRSIAAGGPAGADALSIVARPPGVREAGYTAPHRAGSLLIGGS